MTLPTRMQPPAVRTIAYAGTILVGLVTAWTGGMLFAVVVGLAAAFTAVALTRMAGTWGQRPLTPVADMCWRSPFLSATTSHREPSVPENMALLAAFTALIALLDYWPPWSCCSRTGSGV